MYTTNRSRLRFPSVSVVLCLALVVSLAAINSFAQETRSPAKLPVKAKQPVSIVIEEGGTTQRILAANLRSAGGVETSERAIAEQEIDTTFDTSIENGNEITFSIVNGGGTFVRSGAPILMEPLGKRSIYLPEISAGKNGDEGVIRISWNGRQIIDDIRIATVAKEDLALARSYFPFGSESVIGQNVGYLVIDENKINNLTEETVTEGFSENGEETFAEALCIRTPFGPGKVKYNGFDPWAVGKRYSYKPEGSYALRRGSGASDDVDAVYRYSWGCGTALKVPDSCTLTINNDGSLNSCCNAAMAAIGHTVKWVNPSNHGFPYCPLAP